jgi:hypothetical protein
LSPPARDSDGNDGPDFRNGLQNDGLPLLKRASKITNHFQLSGPASAQ